MKRISKHTENFVFLLLFAGSIVIYSTRLIDSNALLGALASICTIYYGSLKLKMENDILFKDLFKSFNQRYDEKINDLINELRADIL